MNDSKVLKKTDKLGQMTTKDNVYWSNLTIVQKSDQEIKDQ